MKKGFTLIELLIVIALLGALAVGLLATIDPFEQLKKGRDTATRNTTSEVYNSLLRYYSVKGAFPWTSNSTSGTIYSSFSSTVDALIAQGELKARFWELAGSSNLSKIYLYSATSDQIIVCFKPESKGFQRDPNTIYDQSGGTTITNCKSTQATGGTDCYFCVQ